MTKRPTPLPPSCTWEVTWLPESKEWMLKFVYWHEGHEVRKFRYLDTANAADVQLATRVADFIERELTSVLW